MNDSGQLAAASARRLPSRARARRAPGCSIAVERAALSACLISVALPGLVTAAGVLLARPDVHPGGDEALIEIGTENATAFDQQLGPYSRFGWSHPGPSWYYLLAPVYRLLGEHSWALTVAVAAMHAAVAALFVWAIHRFGPRWSFVGATVALLLYFTSLSAEVWRAVWNPYALLLPAGLLVVLCAGAVAGSRVAPVGALVGGSFLIQTHIGTLPLVVALWAACAALLVASRRHRRHESATPERLSGPTARHRDRGWQTLGAGVLMAMWLPPLLQQATAQPGNLNALVRFFTTSPGAGQSWATSVSALGRELAVFPRGRSNATLPADVARLPLTVLGLVVGYALLAAGLAVVAWRCDRFLAALGVLTLVGLLVSVLSVRRIIGAVDDYLILWQSVLAILVWIGWVGVLARRYAGSVQANLRRQAAAGVSVVVVLGVLAGVELRAQEQLPPLSRPPPAAAGVSAAGAALTDEAAIQGPVLVRIQSPSAWPLAAGLVLELRKRGADPAVTDDWAFMFGEQLRAHSPRYVEVVVVAGAEVGQVVAGAEPVADVSTAQGPMTVLVRRSAAALPTRGSTPAAGFGTAMAR